MNDYSSKETQAAFRLGQLDMQQAVADALLAEADGTYGLVAATLIHASELVRNLNVPCPAGGAQNDA